MSARQVRRFQLERDVDVSGVSGTGSVAFGAQAPDGTCVLWWDSEHDSIGIYPTMETLLAIHGHGGTTRVVYIDGLDQKVPDHDVSVVSEVSAIPASSAPGSADGPEPASAPHGGRAPGGGVLGGVSIPGGARAVGTAGSDSVRRPALTAASAHPAQSAREPH